MQDAFMSTKTARRHNTCLEMHYLGMHNISVTRFFHAIGIVKKNGIYAYSFPLFLHSDYKIKRSSLSNLKNLNKYTFILYIIMYNMVLVFRVYY